MTTFDEKVEAYQAIIDEQTSKIEKVIEGWLEEGSSEEEITAVLIMVAQKNTK